MIMGAWKNGHWKDIPGYEGRYQVTKGGLVRSRWKGGRNLRPSYAQGYRQVVLHFCGTKQTFKVSALVLLAYVGPCPPGMEICHGNGIRRDDRLANLRYDTRQSNRQDREWHRKSGKIPRPVN